MKILLPLTLFTFLFLLSFKPVFAKIEINNPPAKIEINKEFTVDVILSNLSETSHFLSIALHKNSGDPYFGLTQNGDNWVEADDSNCKNFPPVTISEGTWSGKLKGKVNYNEKDFDNSLGNYILKIFKYTGSCNKSSSDGLTIELFDPNPPTLTPTSAPTAIHTAAPTSSPASSSTPKPQNTPTKYTSPTTVKTSSSGSDLKLLEGAAPTSTQGAVLGESADSSSASTEAKKSSFPVFLIFLGSGLLFIGAAIIVSAKQIRDKKAASS